MGELPNYHKKNREKRWRGGGITKVQQEERRDEAERWRNYQSATGRAERRGGEMEKVSNYIKKGEEKEEGKRERNGWIEERTVIVTITTGEEDKRF